MTFAILPTHARVEQLKKLYHGFPPTMTTRSGQIPLVFTLEGIIGRCVNLAGTRLDLRQADIDLQIKEFENFANALNGVSKAEKNNFKQVIMLLIADVIQLYTTLNLYEEDGTSPFRFYGFESLTSLNVQVVT